MSQWEVSVRMHDRWQIRKRAGKRKERVTGLFSTGRAHKIKIPYWAKFTWRSANLDMYTSREEGKDLTLAWHNRRVPTRRDSITGLISGS